MQLAHVCNLGDCVARPSPQTERIHHAIDFFVANPGQAHTLADIARHLGVSKAGCLPMISALTDAGWLIRHPRDKTYRLGPALVTIGRAAELVNPSDYAVETLRHLAHETGAPCIALLPSGDHVVLTEIAHPLGSVNEWMGLKRGHQLRAVAPLGLSLYLHSDDEAINAWLSKSSLRDVNAARAAFLPAVEASRKRGYVVELRLPTHEIFVLTQRLLTENRTGMVTSLRSMSRLTQDVLREHEYLVAEIANQKMYRPIAITAPVYGPEDNVELILAITDLPEPITGVEVQRLGMLVKEAADHLTKELTGE